MATATIMDAEASATAAVMTMVEALAPTVLDKIFFYKQGSKIFIGKVHPDS